MDHIDIRNNDPRKTNETTRFKVKKYEEYLT